MDPDVSKCLPCVSSLRSKTPGVLISSGFNYPGVAQHTGGRISGKKFEGVKVNAEWNMSNNSTKNKTNTKEDHGKEKFEGAKGRLFSIVTSHQHPESIHIL